MKFFLLTSFFAFTLASYGQIAFSDANFKTALIDAGVDTDLDTEISQEEAEAVAELDLRGKSIANVEGLEYFVNLAELNLGGNNLSEIVLTGLTKLKSLNANDNTQSLIVDLSNSLSLEYIGIQGSNLTCIDMSMQANLTGVHLNNNPISGVLNASKSANLMIFQAASCPNVTKICVPTGSVQNAAPGNFVKNATAEWSEDCAANEGMTCAKITTGNTVKFEQGNFDLNPSLFSETFNLEIEESGSFDVMIIDISGNTVYSNVHQKGIYALGNNLSKGMYLVKVNGMNKFKSFKIQKF